MDMRTLTDNQGQWRPQASGDKRYIEFHTVSWQNRSKSNEAGRPIFEPITFVKIQHPGEHDFVDRPATEADQREFPRQWEAYQAGKQAVPAGTLLATLFPNHPEVIDMMRFQKVFTVEQLAALNDTQLQNLGMGGRKFQQEAREFLSAAEKGKEFHEMRARLERQDMDIKARDEKIAKMEAAISRLQERDGASDTPQQRGPGRPPNPRPNI